MSFASQTSTPVAAQLAVEVGEFLTVAEIAALLRVTKPTVYGLVESGAFGEVVRVGRAIRIPVAGFRTYMTSLRAAA